MGKRSGNSFKKGCSFIGNKIQNTGSSSSSSQSGGSKPICTQSGRRHRRVCHRVSGACFWCGKTGHVIKDCPIESENTNRPIASSTGYASASKTNARTNTGKEPLRQGRVFALMPGDVQNTEVVVSAIHPICSQNVCVLIGSGSTHSFVSHAFSQKLTKPLEPMPYVLSVSTPSGDSMTCAYVYSACDIVISDMTFADVETIPVACEFPNVFPNDLPEDLVGSEIEFTIEKELLCDLEKNEIKIVMREQGEILAVISAQLAIIEEIKEKQPQDEFLKKIMDEIDSKPRPEFLLMRLCIEGNAILLSGGLK
ncbi:uncharacterized protein LOC114306172 [Camellia sinensis]|uniref:uncharacterized protein LOC114306172 n=1 Tax=Camellia sinensis TaxID=4442 RepID=UPI001035F885|nr:uncharacterized protein LOC114306172 [Camellia sinensis]